MSTPTPRTDKMSESLLSKTFLTSYVTMQELARTLERELSESRNAERLARVQLGAEREKVKTLRSATDLLMARANDELKSGRPALIAMQWHRIEPIIAALVATEETK